MAKRALGLTVVLLLAAMALSACGTSDTSDTFSHATGNAYDTIKPQIQNAVTAYTVDHQGELPPHTGSVDITTQTGSSVNDCGIINLCALIGINDLLRSVPDGCYGYSGQANTNFFSGSCDNPTTGHYVWVIDYVGNVYSICDENRDGTYSSTDRVDGQHDNIWP